LNGILVLELHVLVPVVLVPVVLVPVVLVLGDKALATTLDD